MAPRRVVVDRVDAAELGHRLRHEVGDGVLAAHVAHQAHGRPAAGADVVGHRFRAARRHVSDNDVRALGRQPSCRCSADV